MPLKIVRLTVENIRRLYAVEVEVKDGAIVLVSGNNAQGKSSLLDAITVAFAGVKSRGAAKNLLREGAEKGYIKIDLGQLVVERWFKAGSPSRLKVTPTDGAPYSNPQQVLDELISKVAFDPSAFVNMSRKDQVAELLRVVPLEIDLGELADRRAKVYEERRDANKEVERLDVLCDTAPAYPDAEGLEGPLSAVDLTSKLQEARENNATIEAARKKHDELRETKLPQLAEDMRREDDEIKKLQEDLARAKSKRGQLSDEWAKKTVEANELEKQLKCGGMKEIDTAELEGQIANIETLNDHYRANQKRIAYHRDLTAAKEKAEGFNDKIKAIDEEKAAALAKAEFPLPGLSFDEDNVTYNGIPFADCSSSEQLKIAVAVAMADNPDIRVITMRQGSMLDDDTLAALAKVAGDREFQIWVEQVGEGKPGIVIENGRVVGDEATYDKEDV